MAGKRQVVVPGGIRKVIQTGGPTSSPGTTIAELGATTVSLAQLKMLLGITTSAAGSSGSSGGSTASILAGAGLLGGGAVIGAVPLYLAQSTPPVIWNDALLPDDFVGGASSGISGIKITDGTNTVNGATQVTFSGATVSGATPNATVTVSGGGGGSAAAIVQSQYLRNSGSNATLTLSSTPTVGNVLVAFALGFDTSSPTHLGLPSGFQTFYYNASNTQGILLGYRVVQSGDGTSWGTFTGGNGGDVYGIVELSGVSSIVSSVLSTSTSGFVLKAANAPGATNGLSMVLVTSDSANAYSSVSGASLLFDGTDTTGGNNHPGVVLKTTALTNAFITYSTTSSFGSTLAAVIQVYGK